MRNRRAKSGDVPLVLGAAGGTGAATAMLGNAAGCWVIAVAGSDEKIAYCLGLGTAEVSQAGASLLTSIRVMHAQIMHWYREGEIRALTGRVSLLG